MRDKREEFWRSRATTYERLDWAIRGGYLHAFLDAGNFYSKDHVLDIGTGTGIIAHTIAPFVNRVVGIDISKDMLSHAVSGLTPNQEFLRMDAANLKFKDCLFTKVTARMVFHHILENTQKAMDESYRVLKKRGCMIFSEGIPPSEYVKQFYTDMFKLKEERITFMEDNLELLMKKSGFKIINKVVHWNRQSSIKNWLENSGLAPEIQNQIFKMHVELDDKGKKDYNMVIEGRDCFIDMKFIILVGQK